MAERTCPRCGRPQPESSAEDRCTFCGAALPPRAALPPPPPPPDDEPATSDDLDPGKRACPDCGEILYATEKRCWRCGHEFEAEPEPVPEPEPAPPASEPPASAPEPPPPPSPVPAATAPAVNPQAQALGVWSLVIGIIGLIVCGGLLSPIAIYLGVRANRTGANSLGTAGLVLGIVGTVLLVILMAVNVVPLLKMVSVFQQMGT